MSVIALALGVSQHLRQASRAVGEVQSGAHPAAEAPVLLAALRSAVCSLEVLWNI